MVLIKGYAFWGLDGYITLNIVFKGRFTKPIILGLFFVALQKQNVYGPIVKVQTEKNEAEDLKVSEKKIPIEI